MYTQLFIIHWLIYTQFKAWNFKTVFYVSLFCFNRLMSSLSKDETSCDSSLTFIVCHYTIIKTVFMYFCV